MRLRFTIRDLLWLTVVVAIVAGIWREAAAEQSLTGRQLSYFTGTRQSAIQKECLERHQHSDL